MIPTLLLIGLVASGLFFLEDSEGAADPVASLGEQQANNTILESLGAQGMEEGTGGEQDPGSQQENGPGGNGLADSGDGLGNGGESREPEDAFQEYDVTLMALGDNLMHMGIVQTGRQEDGTYDYSFLFQDILPYLEQADIKMINQETILGGNELGFSGFPYFNSPTEVGDAIVEAGFSVVLHATNHAADQGIKGLYHCVDYWKQHPEVMMTGILGEEDTESIPLLEVGGLTFAILNYTYGPNMEVLPSNLRGHLNMLCAYNEKTGAIDFTTLNPQVIADIEEVRALADIVVVCPHWGTEYQDVPSSYQRSFAEQMAQAGADLIIGTHPHVPQPVEWVEAENGRKALCYYSLGNYVSTQKQALCMLEGMAWVTFHVTEEGVSIAEEKSGVLPLVCQYRSGPVRLDRVYTLEEYTEELAASHGIRGYGGVTLRLSDLQDWSREIFGDWVMASGDILEQGKEE